MKKTLIFVFLLLALGSVVFASSLTFSMVPKDGTLYKEPIADPYAFVSRLSLQKALDTSLRPTHIRSAVKVFKDGNHVKTEYIDLPYQEEVVNEPDKYSTYLHMRMGLSASILRLRYEGEAVRSLDLELTLSGALNTIFNIYSNSNALEFDGTWFIGPSLRVNDWLTFKAGIHHFSGHYGDETLDRFYDTNQVDFSDNGKINADFASKDPEYDYYLNNLVEYVRDNYWIIGTSVDLPYGFRVYGEFEWPKADVWLRPFTSTPTGHKSGDGSELIQYIGGASEGFTDAQVANEIAIKNQGHYNALRCHAGLEFYYNIPKFGALFASADIQFHQDGQTKHMPGQYSPDNPWEKEYTIALGVELGQFVPGKNVRIELIYHDGRVSGTDFFYQRTKTVSIGASIS